MTSTAECDHSTDTVRGRPGARVTLVTVNYAPERTGIAAYTTSLAEGLSKAGRNVTVLTAAPHYPAWRTFPSDKWQGRESSRGVVIRRVKSYVPRKPNPLNRAVFEALYGLRLAFERLPPSDVVLLVSPALFTSVVMRAKFALLQPRTPTVLWLQDRYSAGVAEMGGELGRLSVGAIRVTESWLARSCDKVVVIHDRWTNEVVRELKVPEDRVSAIRNWTHVRAPSRTDIGEVRQQNGWKPEPEEIVILHSGNMGAKQGLENVVAAARLAEERGLSLRFVLMGDGNQRARLEELASDVPTLQFMPFLSDDEYTSVLAAADVLLINELPGLKETAVPSKLTSYFVVGRPVLAATDTASVTADEIRLSGAGAVVPPGNPEALLEGALRLGQQKGSIDSCAGPRFAAGSLSSETAIQAFGEMIDRLADRRARVDTGDSGKE